MTRQMNPGAPQDMIVATATVTLAGQENDDPADLARALANQDDSGDAARLISADYLEGEIGNLHSSAQRRQRSKDSRNIMSRNFLSPINE